MPNDVDEHQILKGTKYNRQLYEIRANTLSQDFYSNTPFNTIRIKINKEIEYSDYASYCLCLYDDQDILLDEKMITTDDFCDGEIDFRFNDINPEGREKFQIRIQKSEADKKNIVFYVPMTYYLDLWEGVLIIEDQDEPYVSDLLMDVVYSTS